MDMKELSLHILDIVENSIRANARLIEIDIDEIKTDDRLTIRIRDDGDGMDPDTLERVMDPFFTTKTGTPDRDRLVTSRSGSAKDGRWNLDRFVSRKGNSDSGGFRIQSYRSATDRKSCIDFDRPDQRESSNRFCTHSSNQ